MMEFFLCYIVKAFSPEHTEPNNTHQRTSTIKDIKIFVTSITVVEECHKTDISVVKVVRVSQSIS